MSTAEKVGTALVGGLIAVAIANVVFRKTSQTPQVLTAGGKALSGSLSAAEGNLGNNGG